MEYRTYMSTKKDALPALLQVGDSFKTISSVEVKSINYNNKPTDLATITTERGTFGTFSAVVIKQLKEFFDAHPTESMDNVKIVQPRGKQYLTIESL